MPSFGKCGGGGRRVSPRVEAPVPVVVSTTTCTSSGAVEDISCTGARLTGESLPPAGEEVMLNVDGLTTFGTIVWSDEDACGIEFDEVLPRGRVLQIENRWAPLRAPFQSTKEWRSRTGRAASPAKRLMWGRFELETGR